jgi:hypothetical protein
MELQPSAVVVRLLHLLCISGAGTSVEHSTASAAAFTLVAELIRKSDSLTRAISSSAVLPHAVRMIVSSADSSSSSVRTVALAAARAATALATNAAHGVGTLAVITALLGSSWASEAVLERRPEGVLEYAAGGHWDATARKSVVALLDAEIGALATVLRVPGPGSLSPGLARWDSSHAIRA